MKRTLSGREAENGERMSAEDEDDEEAEERIDVTLKTSKSVRWTEA
jgi:hypothetical protein